MFHHFKEGALLKKIPLHWWFAFSFWNCSLIITDQTLLSWFSASEITPLDTSPNVTDRLARTARRLSMKSRKSSGPKLSLPPASPPSSPSDKQKKRQTVMSWGKYNKNGKKMRSTKYTSFKDSITHGYKFVRHHKEYFTLRILDISSGGLMSRWRINLLVACYSFCTCNAELMGDCLQLFSSRYFY